MSLSVLNVLYPRNLPGFPTGGYPRSRYYVAPPGNGSYGTTHHPTYEGPYPQPPMPPRVQPGMPTGYNTSHLQGSEQLPLLTVPPADFPRPPSLSDVRRQIPRHLSLSLSPPQSSAGTHNAFGGSYTPQSATGNESYFPHNSGGFFGQQNPPPMTPPRSHIQGSAGGDWNVMGGSHPHSGQSANGSYSPHPPAGFYCQIPRPMPAAAPYRGPAGVQGPSGQYP